MIKATNVTKDFGKLRALDNVSVSYQEGQCVALIGPNGSGKTTLIKCLLGMVVPDSGFITFDQQNIAKDWRYRAHIGYMPQIGRYPDNMTIRQVLDMMKDIRRDHGGDYDDELVKAFGLGDMMDKRMRTLSGGTRQKVSASLAFLFRPKVLILDEPTAGLDPLSAELLKEKIRRTRDEGRLVLITSHILSELEDIVTEIVFMQDGRLVFHKSRAQLQEDTGEEKLGRALARVMNANQVK